MVLNLFDYCSLTGCLPDRHGQNKTWAKLWLRAKCERLASPRLARVHKASSPGWGSPPRRPDSASGKRTRCPWPLTSPGRRCWRPKPDALRKMEKGKNNPAWHPTREAVGLPAGWRWGVVFHVTYDLHAQTYNLLATAGHWNNLWGEAVSLWFVF